MLSKIELRFESPLKDVCRTWPLYHQSSDLLLVQYTLNHRHDRRLSLNQTQSIQSDFNDLISGI